jgi:hypothetical protein
MSRRMGAPPIGKTSRRPRSARSGASSQREMPRRSKARLETLVETMGPPISTAAWSPSVVAQTLEVLPVGLRDGVLFWLKPIHADSLRVGLSISTRPAEAVLDAMGWYPLEALVVHSTSWRHEEGFVILTFLAVVKPPAALPPDSLLERRIERAELARGDATSAPQAIGVAAVLEHAMRHLSWLVRDDPAISAVLADWKPALAAFQPEPFRALA